MDENRERDIKIAKALDFKVERGVLYAPRGTLLGGDYYAHAGITNDTPGIEDKAWEVYTPHFSTSIDDAFWLLAEIRERYGLQYGLFIENDLVYHSCEVGFWDNEPEHRNEVWSGCEKEPALAIAKAVEQCEVVMSRIVQR